MSEQQPKDEQVKKWMSKEELLEKAERFLQINLGDVREMSSEDKRAYYETAGILMFYVTFVWDVT